MLRQFVLGLGMVAAICMPVASADARDINLHCSIEAGLARPGDPPWITATPMFYRINVDASAVNGEILQIDSIDVKGQKLKWDRPANPSVPAAHYIFDLGTGVLFVSFDKFEHDGRKFASAVRRLRCTDRSLKIAA
jgi:hypothetical protein